MSKRLAALLILGGILAPLPGAWAADYFESGFHVSGYFETGYFEAEEAGVSVPDVVGEADFATADGILEGVGLDGGTETVRCSAETANEIIAQNPAAGISVPLATLVDLISSSGTACAGRALQIGIEQRTGVSL